MFGIGKSGFNLILDKAYWQFGLAATSCVALDQDGELRARCPLFIRGILLERIGK
jgi:hypothetical protein